VPRRAADEVVRAGGQPDRVVAGAVHRGAALGRHDAPPVPALAHPHHVVVRRVVLEHCRPRPRRTEEEDNNVSETLKKNRNEKPQWHGDRGSAKPIATTEVSITEHVAGVEGLAGEPLAVVDVARPPGRVANQVRRPGLRARGGRHQDRRCAQERGDAACTASSPTRHSSLSRRPPPRAHRPSWRVETSSLGRLGSLARCLGTCRNGGPAARPFIARRGRPCYMSCTSVVQ
jgi:hypothetical protein